MDVRLGTFLILSAVFFFTGCQRDTDQRAGLYREEVAPEFSAPNWDGSIFHLQDHRGKVVILTFGYTFCPDVCPFTLGRLAELHKQLGKQAEEVSVVFVSVDPERDTREKLTTYVPSFNKNFYGLRPEGGDMASMLADYKIKVTKHLPDKPGDRYYAVDHTGDIFIIGRKGKVRAKHPYNASTDTLLANVQNLLME